MHYLLINPAATFYISAKKKKYTDATWNSWAKANKEWTVLGTEPYQHVSIYIQNLFLLVLTKSYAIFLDSCN